MVDVDRAELEKLNASMQVMTNYAKQLTQEAEENTRRVAAFLGQKPNAQSAAKNPAQFSSIISTLSDGSKKVSLVAEVVEVGEGRVTKTNQSVRNVTIKDASGSITLVLWGDDAKNIQLNDVVQIDNGYVDSYNGKIQLNTGRYGSFKVRK